jgi:hypothetical protein
MAPSGGKVTHSTTLQQEQGHCPVSTLLSQARLEVGSIPVFSFLGDHHISNNGQG